MTEVAAAFIQEMLRIIRFEFYRRLPEKTFFQERQMLIRAITHPAAWMHRHGANPDLPLYRKILRTVIATVKQKGRCEKPLRWSAYLLHCVQEHMNHHGEEYYYASKPVGGTVAATLRQIRATPRGDHPTAVLAAAHKAVRSPGGRRRIQATNEPDLFAQCSKPAARVQNTGKSPSTVCNRARDSEISLSSEKSRDSAARDSVSRDS